MNGLTMNNNEKFRSFKSKENIHKKESQKKYSVIASFNKAFNLKIGIQPNGITLVYTGSRTAHKQVMFHFMFDHYTFSSVWVAEWPPFGK